MDDGSRAAKASRLVDYFVVVGIDEADIGPDLMPQYEPKILNRFPMADIEGCPVNGSLHMLPMFNFPCAIRAKIESEAPLPTSFPYIFTLGDGRSSFVTCLVFYEPLFSTSSRGCVRDDSGKR